MIFVKLSKEKMCKNKNLLLVQWKSQYYLLILLLINSTYFNHFYSLYRLGCLLLMQPDLMEIPAESTYSKWYQVLFQGELTPSVPPIQCLRLSATCGSLILLILLYSSRQNASPVSAEDRNTSSRSFLVTMMSSNAQNSGET